MYKEIVSIIVPVYNAEKYLDKCIQSILNQSFKDFKLYLINDGSNDNSDKIIQKHLNDTRVKYVSKKNEGVAKTRNFGIELVQGKYIMFIDNDDFIDKNYLSNYYNEISKNKLDIVYGGYREVNSKNRIIKRSKYCNNKLLSRYVTLSPWAKIYNANFIKKNQISFLNYSIGEDVYFNIKAFGITKKVKEIDYIGYNWFNNDNSVSRSKQNRINKMINPLILLNRINEDCIFNSKKVKDYFLFRYIIWYLFYTCKKCDKKVLINSYYEYTSWIDNNLNYYKYYIFNGLKNGENLKVHLIVLFSYILMKLKILKCFLFMYSKI